MMTGYLICLLALPNDTEWGRARGGVAFTSSSRRRSTANKARKRRLVAIRPLQLHSAQGAGFQGIRVALAVASDFRLHTGGPLPDFPGPLKGRGGTVIRDPAFQRIAFLFSTNRFVMAPTTAQRPPPAVSPDAQLHLRERRISVDEYFAMGRAGILAEDDRVELLDGRLIDMPPIGPPHSHGVNDLEELFARRIYTTEEAIARLSIQNPIQLDEYGAPEPDVVLFDPTMPKDRHPRPDDIYLVVEVAESSVEYDRDVKAEHYAAAGIPAYWLVDLPNEVVDVFRQPEDDGYAERSRHRAGDALAISTLPAVEAIPVGEVVGG